MSERKKWRLLGEIVRGLEQQGNVTTEICEYLR